jgi:hypothetical protein
MSAALGSTLSSSILGTWGKPPDDVAWVALFAAGVLLVLALGPDALRRSFGLVDPMDDGRRRRVVLFAAFAAAFLSLGYVAYYLRGGPRIIDATTYFLQGRALSHGKLAWKAIEPTASFRGRFLLAGEGGKLAGIFPPGYPLLLAAGFLVGAPMVIGPLLGAALVVLTYWLTLELTQEDARLVPEAPAIASVAVALSVLSAALRYHTADTMSHGAAAVGIAAALAAALRGRRLQGSGRSGTAMFAAAGLAVGWVASTRMASSLPIGVVVFIIAKGTRSADGTTRRWPSLGLTIAGMVPGVLLLALANRAATGSPLGFAQHAYYAVSDGPPGCFRYGFGAGIGCLFEHGDFVRAHLLHGFGLVAALGTTFRRLRMHLLDVANLEPLALLVLVPALLRSRAPRSLPRLAVLLVLGQIVAYAPFYFDGNYPGGGARLFADVRPVEHALVAIAVAMILPGIAFARRGLLLLSLVCAGFAVHAVNDHIALASRDGGRPAYEPDVGHESQISRGLVFFSNDEAFNLAYDPKAEPSRELLAARQHNDDHDRLVYDRLGHPPSYSYRMGANVESSTLNVWVPPAGSNEDFWRFESEADWPPLAQTGGWAEPDWMSGTCASGERAITLRPTPESGEASVTIELPVPRDGRWLVTPRIVRRGGAGKATLKVVLPPPAVPDPTRAEEDAKLLWTWNDQDGHDSCTDVGPHEAVLTVAGGARLVLTTKGGRATLDRVNLRWVKSLLKPVPAPLVAPPPAPPTLHPTDQPGH